MSESRQESSYSVTSSPLAHRTRQCVAQRKQRLQTVRALSRPINRFINSGLRARFQRADRRCRRPCPIRHIGADRLGVLGLPTASRGVVARTAARPRRDRGRGVREGGVSGEVLRSGVPLRGRAAKLFARFRLWRAKVDGHRMWNSSNRGTHPSGDAQQKADHEKYEYDENYNLIKKSVMSICGGRLLRLPAIAKLCERIPAPLRGSTSSSASVQRSTKSDRRAVFQCRPSMACLAPPTPRPPHFVANLTAKAPTIRCSVNSSKRRSQRVSR